jgi:hypothetical protein
VDYHYVACRRVSFQSNPSGLGFAVFLVRNSKSHRVQKHACGPLKIHPVFPEVGVCLDRVPFELIKKPRHSRLRSPSQRGFTVTVTSRVVNNCPSSATARSTYTPGALKLIFDVSVTGSP